MDNESITVQAAEWFVRLHTAPEQRLNALILEFFAWAQVDVRHAKEFAALAFAWHRKHPQIKTKKRRAVH